MGLGRKGGAEICAPKLLHEAGGDAVVAIEDYVFEEGGDAVPAGGCGGFEALDAGGGGDDDVAAAHRAADQNNFDFDLGAGG